MGRYLLLSYNKEMRMPRKLTNAQMEEGMKPWRDFITPLMKKGVIESIAPVQWKGKAVSKRGSKSYKPRMVDVGGFMVIKAKSMAEAIKIARNSPHAATGMGSTIVRECIEMPM